MTAAIPAATIVALPEWVPRLRAEGGEKASHIPIKAALPYLGPGVSYQKALRRADRYIERIDREVRRRHSILIDSRLLLARRGELPATRDPIPGSSVYVSKHLLELLLLGYEP